MADTISIDQTQWHSKALEKSKKKNLKIKMRSHLSIIAVVILVLLPYSSTLSLPSGDPAPGRSPGPPKLEDAKVDGTVVATVEEPLDYDTTTEEVESTTVSDVSVSEKTVGDACAFARIPSDSEEVVTLDVSDSDVNLTVSHPVFEAEELVRGVVYDVHLQSEDITLRDYALHTTVSNFIRGNFTPTSLEERPCYEQPYFVPRSERSHYWLDEYRPSGYYFRTRQRRGRGARSLAARRRRRRFLPARVVSGPLQGRSVLLQWALADAAHLDLQDTSVVFRLRYRKTSSATIYQVFFTKILRLECAIRLRVIRSGRVHSGHLPRTHGCRLLIPQPSPKNALLIELHKLNVPCSSGFIRFAPNTPTLCGKLEQIPSPNRRFTYLSTSKNPTMELHGRPSFAATYRLVDHCHDILLTANNGSFEVGPATKLSCSYRIHLPYGNRVAMILQMGTGPNTSRENDVSNIIHEDVLALCRGMELTLEDGESRWKHCSQPGDPLRSVQIISEANSIRLNISVLAKRDSSAMWLKVFWMDKAIEEVVGHCDYGWVLSGDFCISAVREAKRPWRQAETECVRLGGHLASVLNERQQQIMDQMLIHAPGAGVDDVYWIGATDAVQEGEFRWSDGLPFSYAHWFPGWRKHSSQPNDDGTSGQDCVEARREFPPRPPPAAPTFMWNDRGCREHNYFVCEKPSVDDPYTASKIQCNETIYVSRAHPHAIVSSPGFPRAYPDAAECVTELRAPPAHTLRLHFEELLTEHEPHCSYDFLEIIETGVDNVTEHSEWLLEDHHDTYSAENEVWEEPEYLLPESDATSAGWSRDAHATRARRLCGDWGGKLKLLRYQSRGNRLRLRFRSDHSRHYAGYRAKITVADSQACMDIKQVLFSGHCYLFSGYPRASWVTAKQVCEGLNMQLASIHSSEEERFIISGIRESSDYSAGSIYWLGGRLERGSVENFSWVDGSAVGYQGWPQYNDTEYAEDECLGIQWKSSPVPSQPSGLYWTLHRCATTGGYVCKRRLNPEHVLRNRTVEGISGVLSSPNHPNHYDNDLDYWVHVAGPADTRLVFVFNHIELEYQKDCLYDFIELRDPLNLKSSRYCGSVNEARWVAAGNRAVLHFHSDYNTQGAGFSLQWTAVDLVGCPSQTITSKEGVLRSPNYPHFLLPNLDCTIDILAPAGKRVFLNISYFDFGFGTFDKSIPHNATDSAPEDSFLEVQVDLQSMPIRPFLNQNLLTGGLFVSTSEILRVRLRTGENVTGVGFFGHFKSVGFLNVSHVVELRGTRGGRLAAPNYPAPAPPRAHVLARLLATPAHTLALAAHGAVLMPPPRKIEDDETTEGEDGGREGGREETGREEPKRVEAREPCGRGNGWIEVKDSYTDNNGTEWILCESERAKRKMEPRAPLIINSYLHALTVTQHAGSRGVNMDITVIVNKDPEYRSKLLLLPDDTALESCYPNPCLHGGVCASEDHRNVCQCAGYYTGVFCLLTACERSPCVFGNCSLVADEAGAGFACACARGWRGKRCAERVRACAARPCNNRGACTERDGGFLCQCNPSWKGKRCEMPNPTPNIVSLGTRMIQEPFWLGLIAVFVMLGAIGLVWCAKRHFPEKIEKLLAEEADRCARPGAAAWRHGGGVGSGGAEPARTLLTRLGIRKPSVSGLSPHPRAARTFSLDDLLKPPPGRKERARFARALRTDAAYHSRSYHSLLLCDFRLHPVLI